VAVAQAEQIPGGGLANAANQGGVFFAGQQIQQNTRVKIEGGW
jgi:hypothetical protein